MSTPNDLEKKVQKKLEGVMDPELFVSIVDLGLIYKLEIKKGRVAIEMTLTTMGCPLFPVLENDIKGKLGMVKGIDDVNIKLVFDPPWSLERMSEKAKAQLGI